MEKFAYLQAPWKPQHSQIHPSDKTEEVNGGNTFIISILVRKKTLNQIRSGELSSFLLSLFSFQYRLYSNYFYSPFTAKFIAGKAVSQASTCLQRDN